VPVEVRHLLPVNARRHRRPHGERFAPRQLECFVDCRQNDLLRLDNAPQPRLKTREGGLFAVDEEEIVGDRQALVDPGSPSPIATQSLVPIISARETALDVHDLDAGEGRVSRRAIVDAPCHSTAFAT